MLDIMEVWAIRRRERSRELIRGERRKGVITPIDREFGEKILKKKNYQALFALSCSVSRENEAFSEVDLSFNVCSFQIRIHNLNLLLLVFSLQYPVHNT